MKNLFKPKNTKLNYTSSHIPLQNHIINMNFPKNPLIFKNSGPKSNKQNLLSNSHLNINVTNLTNSLIVNQNPNFNHNNIINNLNNNINNSIAPQIKNSKPTRRSKSQTNFNKIGVKEISMQQKD